MYVKKAPIFVGAFNGIRRYFFINKPLKQRVIPIIIEIKNILQSEFVEKDVKGTKLIDYIFGDNKNDQSEENEFLGL